jgi:uncharacterized membrane protein (UPF0127 family)
VSATPDYELINDRTGETIASRARLADNPATRSLGLMFKKALPAGEALIIRPCWSIHTVFMRFRLDVLFLDKSQRVKKVVRQMPAYRFAASRGAHETIELTGGSLEGLDLQPGDQVVYRPLEGGEAQ